MNERYVFKLGANDYSRTSKSRPSDYNNPSELFTFGASGPLDQFKNYYVAIGRIYKLNRKGSIKVNISAGLGFTILDEVNEWYPINDGIFGSNYAFSSSKTNTVSLLISPKIEFPFTRFYGLSISSIIQINRQSSLIGIGIGHNIGKLREKYEAKKSEPLSKFI